MSELREIIGPPAGVPELLGVGKPTPSSHLVARHVLNEVWRVKSRGERHRRHFPFTFWWEKWALLKQSWLMEMRFGRERMTGQGVNGRG